jgi:hypothetical protein
MFACWAHNLQHKHKFKCHYFLNECKALKQTLWHYLTIFILNLTLNDHALYYHQGTLYIWLNAQNVMMPKLILYGESVFNSYSIAALCTILIYSQITLVWTDQVSATSFPHNHSVNKSFPLIKGVFNSEKANTKTEINFYMFVAKAEGRESDQKV